MQAFLEPQLSKWAWRLCGQTSSSWLMSKVDSMGIGPDSESLYETVINNLQNRGP